MADAKPQADTGDSSAHGATADSFRPRWLRFLPIVILLVIAVGIAVVAFAVWGPAPGATVPSQPPGMSPSDSPTTSAPPTPSSPPTDTPAAPPDKPPVAIDEEGPILPGLTAEISAVEAVEGIARGPGEVAGPSLRVTVSIVNSTAADAALNATVVSAYFGADRTPAPELHGPGGSPLPTVVGAGMTATGVYIFTVPENERTDVTLMVDYSVDVDPLVFHGDITPLVRH